MSDELIVAIDHGTQSVRALLFDLRGRLVAKSRVPLPPPMAPRPGWAEHDAEDFWSSLAAACRGLWAQPGLRKDTVKGVALTTQRGTVVPLGEAGRPLRPAILWLDQRRTARLPPLGGGWDLLFRLARLSPTVAYLRAEAEANWIRAHEPEVWRATHKFLLLSGYLTYRLTGRFVDSVGCQVGYLPFDYRRQTWARSWDWKWRAVPMERAWLPELVAPGTILGEVTAEAAEATGLPPRLPVVAAAADKACEVLGAGCLEPHLACLSYGTTATVNTTHRRYVESIPLLPAYPSAVPGAFSLEVQVARGFWMVTWFAREFAAEERRLAAERGVDVEALLDEEVAAIAPGSMGLLLQPYWSPGIRSPGPEAKGAVIGFGDVHTRAHLYRAILEGLAYALREGAERIASRAGTPVSELRVAGGGSRSDAALQIAADVFGLPTARPEVSETSGLGAAIDAAVGLGLHADFAIAVREMTRVGTVFLPDSRAHVIYEQLYRQVYRRLYDRLRPLYAQIADITGYPDLTDGADAGRDGEPRPS